MSADHLELLVIFGKKENHVKASKDFHKYHFDLVWEVNPHPIPKALDISKKIPLTSKPSSNDL